jgi:ATP-dependent RNA helicase SUPV3L1/SUV3
VTIGALDVFDARLIKPEPARWRRALLATRVPPADVPPAGPASVLARDAPGASLAHGFRPLGPQAVRVDLVERIAKIAFDARQGRKPFAPDAALATSIGLVPETLARLMAQLGFRSVAPVEGRARWMWHGVPPRPPEAAPVPGNAFAALAGLRHG